MIKQQMTANLGRGRGGRPCAGEKPKGPTPQMHVAVPVHDRERLRILAQMQKTTESELVRKAITEFLLKFDTQLGQSQT